MLFSKGIFISLLLQVMGKSICGPGKSCTGDSQCMITTIFNISSTVKHCSEVVNTKCLLYRRGKNALSPSRSEYYDTITSRWKTTSTVSYTFTEVEEKIDAFYCYLYEERHINVKREEELQSAPPTTPTMSALPPSPFSPAILTSPTTSGNLTSSTTSSNATSPTTSANVTSPTTSANATSHRTSANVTSPTTSANATSPTTSAHVTSPPTSGWAGENLTKTILMLSILLGTFIVIVYGTSSWMNSQGFFQKRVDNTCSSNPLFCTSKNDISLSFELTLPNERPVPKTDIELVDAIVSQSQNRIVVFESRSGSGKTCFFQNILRKWENGEVLRKYHLIYLQRCYTKTEISLADLVDKVCFYMRNVKTTIHRGRLILILDGLNVLQLGLRAESISSLEKLNNEHFFYDEIQFWMGVRECKVKEGSNVNEHVPKVCVEPCNEDQLKSMFAKLVIATKKECGRSTPDEIWKTVDMTKMLKLPLLPRLLAMISLHRSAAETSKEQIDIVSKFCSNQKFNKTKDFQLLMNYGAWDLLACLIEAFIEEDREHIEYAKMLHGWKIKFEHIDDDYPRQAILHLFYKMKREKRHPSSIEFVSRDPTFLKGYLPKVEERLVFSNSCFQSESFFSFVKIALKSCEKIQFCRSKLPKKMQKILGVSEDAKVTHMRGNVEYTLDFQTGEWKTKKRSQRILSRIRLIASSQVECQ